MFLKRLASVTVLGGIAAMSQGFRRQEKAASTQEPLLKTSLNAYSFNQALTNGKMNIDQLLEFCAKHGFEGVDLTGYYFPGYPKPPADDYIFHVKRKAFSLGLGISGTGVRNDFTYSDKTKLTESLELVKQWTDVAAKLGAPVIRVFAGTQEMPAAARPATGKQVIEYLRVCADYGKQKGVIIAMQNHNDFIKTAEHVHNVMKGVNSEWFGLVLDIGSYRSGDPFAQIGETAKYAVNWQIKENMFVQGREVVTDLKKLIPIIKASGYRGYLPIETLGPGDPELKVPAMLNALKKELAK
jgi:sugar phosphate isomerase/epimerase